MPHQFKNVPTEPTEAQWSGLASDIMMWMDMDYRKTPNTLIYHLNSCGTNIPKWLFEEEEMLNVDSVISKGTLCVIIYKAMLDAYQIPGELK